MDWARAFYFQFRNAQQYGHKSGLALVVLLVTFFPFSRSELPPFSVIISHVHSRRSGRAIFLKNYYWFGALRLPFFICFFKIALQCFGGCLSRFTYHRHRTSSELLRALCLCVPLQPPPRHPFATSFRFDFTTGAHLGGDLGKLVALICFVSLNRR